MTLARVAAGSQAMSKTSLGGDEAGLLVEADFHFKMVWALCMSPATRGVVAVVAGAACPAQPGLLAPKTLERYNCPSLTQAQTTHVHKCPFPSLTHSHLLSPCHLGLSSRGILKLTDKMKSNV